MVFLELYSRHPFGKQLWRVTVGNRLQKHNRSSQNRRNRQVEEKGL